MMHEVYEYVIILYYIGLKIKKKYIASCAIWVSNMVSYIKGGIQAKGI
jgi:hypothetical protein